jgi:thiol-disulfide isomerase/thioredoxin
MKKFKKFFLAGFLVLGIFGSLAKNPALAEKAFRIYFFYGKHCPHCAKEEKFLEKLEEKYPFLEVRAFEVTESPKNSQLLKKVTERLKVNLQGIPFTVVHKKSFSGYLSDETTGKEIEEAIKQFSKTDQPDLFADLVPPQPDPPEEISQEELTINLPVLGQFNAYSFSLPVLTILIAGIDGFNPCAMWVLLFLISLLLGMKDKKRMWLLGGTFILASSLVYFLFLSAWLNLFLFIGFIFWIRLLIGAVAITCGVYYLREYWTNRAGVCKVIGQGKKQKIMSRLRKITQKKQLFAALLGIVLLAFAVNLIELVCSAGLPAVYTQVLALAKLPRWQHYLYLLLYILIFMLDDLVVFYLAMTTLNATGVTGKYSRYSHLIGGLIIFILGILLIFKPEWLMFG